VEQAYIIVSDVHLGSKKCNQKEFCSFLEWIHGLANKPKIIKYKDKEIIIRNPSKIILLGDILELWDPKDGDRDNVIKDSMRPFSLLSNIGCDKVYVVGNHDDSLSELDKKIDYEILDNGTKFDIYNRHYPEKDEKSGIANGIKIGNRSYFFLHGHQFDKEQAIFTDISQLMGENWNPLDWFQVLYNITYTKKHWKRNLVIFLVLLLGGKRFLWNGFLKSSFLSTLLWSTVTGFFALNSIPGVVAHSQRIIYNSTKPIDMTAEQVIENKYYKSRKDTIDADAVIFGHTHFASSYELILKTGKKLFINSGCWVGTDTDFNGKMRYTNTFVYLDDSGVYIMTWRGSGKISCIEAFI
jgi:UDP-2,3-diacylglucosamine pyrophosphatase LpxH